MKVGYPKSNSRTRAASLLLLLGSTCCEEDSLGPPRPSDVFRGLSNTEAIAVTLKTDRGDIHCSLDASRAPNGVALFVGLATGRARWRHPTRNEIMDTPLYRDLPFHRAIPKVMVQTGSPTGNVDGNPGYRIPVESRPSDPARLRTPGALVLARYTPPPERVDPNPPPAGHVLGSQFGITLTDMSHLAGRVSVLGTCKDLNTVAKIAAAVRREKQLPRLERITVTGISDD